MDEQSRLIEKHLLELLDPSTTPERALESLSFPCFSIEPFTRNSEPVLIFLAYMRFIITRLPDACVVGIWEDILRKTVMHSLNFSRHLVEITHVRRKHPSVVLADGPLVSTWLQKALNTHLQCPNPYIRLELFRLIRILLWRKNGNIPSDNWKRLCDTLRCVSKTFIHTISEIDPHYLYPSGGEYSVLFNFTDLEFIFSRYRHNVTNNHLQKFITDGLIEQLKNCAVDVDCVEARFILHCIQLIGIFTFTVDSLPGQFREPPITMITNLCDFFKNHIGNLINHVDIPRLEYINTQWDQFRWVLQGFLPFKPYITATICDLRSAMINNKCSIYSANIDTIGLIDSISLDLGVCSKTCDLPRLLLSRQVQGPTSVQQHALLARHREPLWFLLISKKDSEDDYHDDDDEEDEYWLGDDEIDEYSHYADIDAEVSDVQANDSEASDADVNDADW
ncbi:unnamed protein product [Meganyctiphanes norvegica]|uniref:Uncharacterized protein n=1 Tax=Meganyctiphanes norvegica TaxID=48144 RepID=A0AAV2R2R2_MEGNR